MDRRYVANKMPALEHYSQVLENLPGGFAVWAASAEAQFLHGRFVWSTWDVNDLMSGELRDQIESDQWLLKVGVRGL